MKIGPRKGRADECPAAAEVFIALLECVKTQRPRGFSLWTFQANAGARRFYERHGLMLAKLGDGSDNEEKLPDALHVWRGRVPNGGSSE